MNRAHKFLVYGIGFVLGSLIVAGILQRREPREPHPWHARTAPEGFYPLTVVDAYERKIQLLRQPRFFISLAPSITEMLFAMDMGDHLVAVTEWCMHPQVARDLRDQGHHIGSIDRPNREAIVALRPDLILGSTLTPPEIYATLHQAPRTNAIAFRHQDMDSILADIRQIGVITGVPGKALQLITRLEQERNQIRDALQALHLHAQPNVLFLLSIEENLQPGWAPGNGTWIGDLLVRSHARNAASAIGTSWGEISMEALLALDPSIILVRDAETAAGQNRLRDDIARMPQHPVWSHLQAVRNRRVHIIPHGPLNIPGPRIMQAYRSIANAIWPDIAGEYTPADE